jgi:multiple sugar transport system substrate-binding protein
VQSVQLAAQRFVVNDQGRCPWRDLPSLRMGYKYGRERSRTNDRRTDTSAVSRRDALRVGLGLTGALLFAGAPMVASAAQPSRLKTATFAYPTEQISLTMFGSDEQPSNDLEKKWASEYNQLHPNVTVDPQLTPLGPAYDKLTAQLPAGSGPDLFTVYEPWIETFYQAGWLAPAIPDVFGVANQQGISDLYVPNSLDAMTRDGTVYLLPLAQPSWGLLINNPKFTAAGLSLEHDIPTTWDQVAALQNQLKQVDANGRITQKGFEFRYTAGPQWMAMLFSAMVQDLGGKVVDDQGNPLFTSPEAVQAMTTWKKLVVAPQISKNVQPSPYQDFADEQDVMSYGGLNAVSFAVRLNPALANNVTFAQLPTSSGKPGSIKYSFNYAVNNALSDVKKVVAWDYIKFTLADRARSIEDFQTTGGIRPLKGWYQDPAVASTPYLDVAIKVIEGAYPLPRTRNYNALQEALANAVSRVALSGADPADSLTAAQAEYSSAVGA